MLSEPPLPLDLRVAVGCVESMGLFLQHRKDFFLEPRFVSVPLGLRLYPAAGQLCHLLPGRLVSWIWVTCCWSWALFLLLLYSLALPADLIGFKSCITTIVFDMNHEANTDAFLM